MKNLYTEYFQVAKEGKIKEKVLLTRLAVMIAIIVFCLAAMGISAYAYFSCNVTSSSNTIKSANFDVTVQIEPEDPADETPDVNSGTRGQYTVNLKANKKYTVTLTPKQGSTAKTGFVILKTADNVEYHTQQLGKDGDSNRDKIEFTLTAGADTTVSFLAHWGTSSCYGYHPTPVEKYITGENKDIELVVNGVAPTDVDANTEKEEEPSNIEEETKPEEEQEPSESTEQTDPDSGPDNNTDAGLNTDTPSDGSQSNESQDSNPSGTDDSSGESSGETPDSGGAETGQDGETTP